MQNLSESSEPNSCVGRPQLVGEGQRPEKLQGHWVLARAGKRVLRPGGLELTRQMLSALAIGQRDRVVEFAPGLGVTARMVLQSRPSAYWGVEREPAAAQNLRQQLITSGVQIVQGPAQASGLPSACASVVFGEAMLSMQSLADKSRVFAEARRLLLPGGRYGIHELCFLGDDTSDDVRHEVQAAMSAEIHVGVQPLSRKEWMKLFEENGLKVTWSGQAPMSLLEPGRVLRDEGFWGSLRIALNLLRNPMLRRRMLAMRRLFRKYKEHIGAISLVGIRVSEST
jgi:ubiquinone/menaquinone biosynthesis C-methylase UbiE